MRRVALALATMLPCTAQTLLILHKGAHSMGIYDAGSGRMTGEIATGRNPHEMEWSRRGKLLYVTNYGVASYTDTAEGGRSVSIVDPAAGRSKGEIDLGEYRRPHGLEVGRRRVYVTVDQPPAVLALDPVKKTVARAYRLPNAKLPHMLAITRDEKLAYVANAGSGSVSVLSLKDGGASEIRVGGIPMGIALAKDGKYVYVATRDGNAVVVVDTARRSVAGRIEMEGRPGRVRLLPDGKRMIVSLIGSGDLALVDLATRQSVYRFHAGAAAEGLGLDGDTGYVSAQGDNKVVRYQVSTGKILGEIRTLSRPDPILAWRR